MKITKHFSFEASHVLPRHKGKCSRLHGHSWKLAVTIEGPIDSESGFVVDYGELKKVVDLHVVMQLDHRHLGFGPAFHTGTDARSKPPFGEAFYPSSENLCRAIFKLLAPHIKELASDVRLYSVTIEETCTSAATWSRLDEPPAA